MEGVNAAIAVLTIVSRNMFPNHLHFTITVPTAAAAAMELIMIVAISARVKEVRCATSSKEASFLSSVPTGRQ